MPKLIAELGFSGSGRLAEGVTRNPLRVALARPVINRDPNSPFFLPLGLLCIASPLLAAGHRVSVVDNEYRYRSGGFALRDGDWLDACCGPVLEAAPHLVGLTALADTLPAALLMGRRIKQESPDTTVVLGGPGTFGSFPGLLGEFADCVDFVCQGEGELAMASLTAAIADGADPYQVKGMWSLRDGALNYRGSQPYTDLDHIPMPAYDAVPMERYLELSAPRIFDMHIGSGCTYSCKFCMTSTFWDRDFRSKSPAVVLRELDWLHDRFGITRVNFLHDNFANKRPYLEGFVEHFAEHNTRYEWGCAVRPDNVTAGLLRRMRDAGCFNIFCGTDAGSEKILRDMQKMPSNKRIYQFFRACRETGMAFETNTIIGYPREAPEDLEASLDVILDAIAYGASSSDLSVLQPLPGAEVTTENLDHLVPVDDQLLGTFLPPELPELLGDEPTRFPGFFFIRNENRGYDYYVEVLRLTRFFTRRYFLFLRFLKQVCGIRYVDAFERLLGTVATDIPDRLPDLLAGLPLPQREAAAALLRYESAVESLRTGDVLAELDNVYFAPSRRGAGPRHLVIDLPVDVVRLFDDPVELRLPADAVAPTTYLVHRAPGGEVRTLRLQPWHKVLVEHLDRDGTVDVSEVATELARVTGTGLALATASVGRASRQIRQALAGAARDEVGNDGRIAG